MLGQLVGARRPTVSTAIAALAKADRLVRRDNGTWLVKGDPAGRPEGEATRVIGERRPAPDLPAGEPVRPVEDAVARIAAADPAAAALAGSGREEMSRTLARLRGEADAQLVVMRTITGQTQELLARTAELREDCRRDRDRRDLARA